MSTRFRSSFSLRERSQAFTLLEVLVSSAILAIVMILLIGMADHTTRIWGQGERRRDASREVRAGLELLTEDLHSAVITTNPSTLVITTDKTETGGSRLFFLVSHPGEKRSIGNEGDLCATGYFIADDPTEKGARNLYRFHASGAVVAQAFANNKLPELYASASLTNTTSTELLARHIVKLDVRRLDGESSSAGLLMISLSAAGNEKAGKNASPLREDQLLRYSTIIRLPPQWNQSPGS